MPVKQVIVHLQYTKINAPLFKHRLCVAIFSPLILAPRFYAYSLKWRFIGCEHSSGLEPGKMIKYRVNYYVAYIKDIAFYMIK